MAIFVKKSPALVEDIEFGFGPTTQIRGGTMVNAEAIPFIDGGDNVKQALEARLTQLESDIRYASLNGNSAELFYILDGTLQEHAVTLRQLNLLGAEKPDIADVIEKGTTTAYTPSSGLDPVNKNYADGLIADKFLGAITGQFIAKSIADGTTDVTVTVTNGVITAIV